MEGNMRRDELVIRSMLFALLGGILVTLIAAWLGIRPETQEQIARQAFLLESPPRVADRAWWETNPLAAGAIGAAVSFAVALIVLSRHRSH
jgi:hypothetical protein